MIYFSLIIPIYNVENYFKDCLDSIFIQLPRDNTVELIFVNDGSEDQSIKILEDYLKILDACYKKNIKIISQYNQGLSVARNNGVLAATSEYIGFLDSDDILLDGYFSKILEVLKNHNDIDIIKFQYSYFFSPKNMINVCYENTSGINLINHDFMVRMLNDCAWYAWLNIYKKEKLLERKFPKNINFEDALTIPYIFEGSERCFILNNFLYGYRKHENSITSSSKSKTVNMNIMSLKYLLSRFLTDAKNGSSYGYIMYIFFLRVYFSYLIKHKKYKIAKSEWIEIKTYEVGLDNFNKNIFIAKKHRVYFLLYLKFGFYANYIIVIINYMYTLLFKLLKMLKIK